MSNRSSQGIPPPQVDVECSSTDPEGSGSDEGSDDQHHRRKSSSSKSASSDRPTTTLSRIPNLPEHKRPKQTKPVSPKPKPVKPKPTEAQVRAREAERDAVKAKRDDRQSQIWHEKNCRKICGSVSHWWWQCEVQYCVYCHSSEHCKYSRIDFETITCLELVEKNKGSTNPIESGRKLRQGGSSGKPSSGATS